MRIVTSTVACLLCAQAAAPQVTTSSEDAIEQIRAGIENDGCEIPRQLVALVGQTAEQRANAAVSLNDFRFIGIAGPNIEVPIVSYSFSLCPNTEDHIQVFEDDPIASRCPTYSELLKSLRTFAAQYNFYIFKARVENGIETCTA